MAESSSSNLLDWTITDAPPADEPLHSPDFSPSPRRTLTRYHHLSVRLWLIVGSLIAVVIAGLWVFSASTLYTYTPVELWCAYCGAPITKEQVDITRWEAEALLDALLADQPTEKETALFQAFRLATSPTAWVAKGLGLSTPHSSAFNPPRDSVWAAAPLRL